MRPARPRKLSGKEEALLVATACANPPQGRARWTLELLADAMVRLADQSELSRETVRRAHLRRERHHPTTDQRLSLLSASQPLITVPSRRAWMQVCEHDG